MFKKTIAALLILLLLCGCANTAAPAQQERLHIVTTIFPIYDWVKTVLGENSAQMQVTWLLDSGVDLHSYQPTAQDLVQIANCDLFVYVGGESDAWVPDALENAAGNEVQALNLLEVLGEDALSELLPNGAQETQHDHEHEHEDEDDHEHEHEHEHTADEHIWLSLRNAATLAKALCDTLSHLDPDGAVDYSRNTAAFGQQLAALDAQYQSAADTAVYDMLVFADRFPFAYLARDYGLTCYAAFTGCSAETEASFETVRALAEQVDSLSLPCILTIEGSNHQIAQTVAAATQQKNQQLLVLDSMQSVTEKDVQNGTTYLTIMEKNLAVLKTALQGQ